MDVVVRRRRARVSQRQVPERRVRRLGAQAGARPAGRRRLRSRRSAVYYDDDGQRHRRPRADRRPPPRRRSGRDVMAIDRSPRRHVPRAARPAGVRDRGAAAARRRSHSSLGIALPRARRRSTACSSWPSRTVPPATARAFDRPAIGDTIKATDRAGARVAGDRPRARHAAGVGGDPAAAEHEAPAGAADPADRRPGGGVGDRLVVPALAAAGLPQRAAAQPAVVEPPRRGSGRHLHDAVDHHHHRVRPDRVRLPVRELRVRQHQLRAARGRPGERLDAASASSSGSRSRCCGRCSSTAAASRCCSGSGQFTGPLLLGRNAGITVLTTRDVLLRSPQSPIDFGAAAAIGIAAARVRRRSSCSSRSSSSATRPASSPTAARRSGQRPHRRSSPSAGDHRATASSPRSCR